MFKKLVLTALVGLFALSSVVTAAPRDGSKAHPLRVMMIPTDGGAADIVADYKPVFDAITRKFGIHFEVRSGESYSAVVRGLCAGQAEIAWLGAVTFGAAKKMCGAKLLAVDVKHGNATYYSGIFTKRHHGVKNLNDLRGKSLAVGSPSSTSSFNFPIAMIINAHVDPVKDIKKVIITGSHSNSIAALREGRVDAAAASFNSWEKAVKKGVIDPKKFKVLAKSQPIPNPPMTMSKDLSRRLQAKLRKAFGSIHKYVKAGQIRGYGGKKVDRYDTKYPEADMLAALSKLSKVTPALKAALIDKSGQR